MPRSRILPALAVAAVLAAGVLAFRSCHRPPKAPA